MKRRGKSFLIAVAVAAGAWAHPASAQVPSNFAFDVHRAIDRGIEWLGNRSAFTIDANGNAEAGDATALMALVLLEKRADARPTAISEGYLGASPANRVHIDRLIDYLITKQSQFFYAYRNGPEMMALSLYVRTGGPNPAARAAVDRAVDEAIYAIGQQEPCTDDGKGGCVPNLPNSPVPCLWWLHEDSSIGCYPVFNEPTDAEIQAWHGYWGYHLADIQDSSATQFVVAGLGAARGLYMDPSFADAHRLALVDKVLARSRAVYEANGALGQPCAAGGPLGSGTERGHAYSAGVACNTGSDWAKNTLQQTASGLWIQLLGGATLNDDSVQHYLEWLYNRYAYTSIAGQPWAGQSYGYYLWSSAKAYFFLERAGTTPVGSNLSSDSVGILTSGDTPPYLPRETHLDPTTAPRPSSAGPEGANYYDDPRESARWYFDYAYSLISRQCFDGVPAALTIPAALTTDGTGISANPCIEQDDAGAFIHNGYFVPVNGRWHGYTGLVAEQAYFILILQRSVGGGCLDSDSDGLCDTDDNCPAVSNAAQVDGDGDNIGDVCDVCPASPANDADGDGSCGDVDNCPLAYNPGQEVNVNGEPVACSPGTIDAVDDAGAVVDSAAGGQSHSDVQENDTLNLSPIVVGMTQIRLISATHAGITLLGSKVNVTPGTPVGNYSLVYEICEIAYPTNCDQATVTVPVINRSLTAEDDLGIPVLSSAGGTSVATVLVNDSLNAAPVNPADVEVIDITDPAVPGVNFVDTSVVVDPGTPAGVYYLNYQLCELAPPQDCDTARVTVPVMGAAIVANDDIGATVDGNIGGVSFASVIVNDTLGGLAINPDDISQHQVATTHGGVFLDGLSVKVRPGTPSGNYTLTYRICEAISGDPVTGEGNCDTANVTVTVSIPVIDAVNDIGSAVNGVNGGTSLASVLPNDTLDGTPIAPAAATVTPVPPAEVPPSPPYPLHPGISLFGTSVVVAPGTPAGTYALFYRLCQTLYPGNCDDAMVTVEVTPAPIDAVNDAGEPVNGATGGASFADVLWNDTLNGVVVASSGITITQQSSTHLGVNLNGLSVVVTAGTPASDYSLVYRICENLNPTNCDSATVTVPVVASAIDAVNDVGASVNGASGGTSFTNVLGNDLLNGAAAAAVNVNTTFVSATHLGVSLSGVNVVVAPGTPAGSYSLDYQICEKLNPANCDTATVTVPVVAALIDAVNDQGASVNGATGGIGLVSVLASDTLNGAPALATTVTTTFVSRTHPGVRLGGAGLTVVVDPGTPAGTYSLTYKICEILNPTNCDTATVTVPVSAPAIDAVNDLGASVNGASGGTSFANVLGNDTLNGAAVLAASVTTTFVSSTHLGVTLTGASVLVAAGTPAGVYTLDYQICETLNPSNCDTATVTVPVAVPAIDAVNDGGASVNGASGGTSFTNVLGNDTLNGAAVLAASVTTTFVSSTHLGVSLSGLNVVVAAGTPANDYSLDYRICEILNPANCDTATVTVPVAVPVIDAVNDLGVSVNGASGGTAFTNVLAADTLNGAPVAAADVTTTFVSSTSPRVTLDGLDVVVAPGTPATVIGAPYLLTYRICENLNPTNCDDATVTVTVTAAAIDAVDDIGIPGTSAITWTARPNVHTNDTLNGLPAVAMDVTASFVSSTHAGLTVNGMNVEAAAGIPAGDYSLVYRLCERLNPDNCDDATVTVRVTEPTLNAADDTGASVNGASGGTSFTNVLVNDTVDGQPVVADRVSTTLVSSTHAGVSLSGLNVVVAAGTPAGSYSLVYRICEVANPTNCDDATVTLTVTAPVINAADDTGVSVNGANGGTSFTNVLGNDTLNGLAVVAVDVTTTFVSSTHPGVTLSGLNVVVAAGTAAGSYSLDYKICENLNLATNCDTATVTVPVAAAVIDAVNDTGVSVSATAGGTSFANVLSADTLNGLAVVAADVTTTFVSSTHTGVSLSGLSVVVAAGTPAGSYSLDYKICENLNPANCDTATVTVPVFEPNKVPVAQDDFVSTNEDSPVTATVVGNDSLGDGAHTWHLIGTNGGATHGTVTMGADGLYIYTPAANFFGTDVFTYEVCDADGDCSRATVTVSINSVDEMPLASNDSNTTSSGTAVTGPVVTNDTPSADGGNTWSLVGANGGAAHGTVTLTSGGVYTYTPAPGFVGTDTFNYQVCDVDGDCATATVTITVTNQPPVAVNDSGTTRSGTPVTISVLANDSDPDGDTLTVISNTPPTSGTVVLNPDGTFTYTPATGFTGTATFSYIISDGKGGTATAIVTILVNAGGSCDDKSRDGKSRDGKSDDGGSHDDKSSDGKSGKAHDGKSGQGHDSKSDDGSQDDKSGKSHDGNSDDGSSDGKSDDCDDDGSSDDDSGDHGSDDHGSGQKRMTGGGSVFTTGKDRVTHGMTLHCDAGALPNNLEVNWGTGENFHLDALSSVVCSDAPGIGPAKPVASFDTMVGLGTGSYNGKPGAAVAFTFTDAGEPGRSDTATINIKDASGRIVLTVSGAVSNGNQQAHGR